MNLSAQREAIMELAGGLRPCVVGPDRRYYLGRKEVYLLGLSADDRLGTPAVAVFGAEPGPGSGCVVGTEDLICAGAVFLRSPYPGEETDEADAAFGPQTEAEVVEAVTAEMIEPRQAVLTPTGSRVAYPVLITAYRPRAA